MKTLQTQCDLEQTNSFFQVFYSYFVDQSCEPFIQSSDYREALSFCTTRSVFGLHHRRIFRNRFRSISEEEWTAAQTFLLSHTLLKLKVLHNTTSLIKYPNINPAYDQMFKPKKTQLLQSWSIHDHPSSEQCGRSFCSTCSWKTSHFLWQVWQTFKHHVRSDVPVRISTGTSGHADSNRTHLHFHHRFYCARWSQAAPGTVQRTTSVSFHFSFFPCVLTSCQISALFELHPVCFALQKSCSVTAGEFPPSSFEKQFLRTRFCLIMELYLRFSFLKVLTGGNVSTVTPLLYLFGIWPY